MVLKLFNRFVFWTIILVAILATGKLDGNFVKIMLHKTSTVIIAFIVAESIWQLGYKIVLGSIETSIAAEKPSTIAAISIFRGILYAAIILGFCIGI
ncbi:MAG: hypothetical protein ABIM30_00410 [candidate division WOR-3 bacterium]